MSEINEDKEQEEQNNSYSTMSISSSKLDEIIGELNGLKERLEQLSWDHKDAIKKMKDCWNGTSGEKAFEILTKSNENYTSYKNNLYSIISFLENVKSAYGTTDSNISERLEENVDEVGDTNGI